MFGSITLNQVVGGINRKAAEAARDAGVKNLVVPHPEWWIVDMGLEDQIRMVKDYDVVLERCYAQNMGGGIYKSNLPDNVEVIREVGYEHILVSTDGGQVENPYWETALAEYMEYLVDHWIPAEQVDYMTKVQPAKLLGLEEKGADKSRGENPAPLPSPFVTWFYSPNTAL